LYYTQFTYTPTPTGLVDNWQTMVNVLLQRFGYNLSSLVGAVSLFGFEFLDVFILLIGFTMAMSWRNEEDHLGYVKRRWLRILSPFWMAVLLTLILSVIDHYITDAPLASAWNWFVAFTFPLAYDFHGTLLQQISGPWWFIPFMLAVVVVSPFMLNKLELWGAKNFLLFFGLSALLYRLLSLYFFGAHTNYSIMKTLAGEAPFLLLPAKLFLVALGLVFGKLIKEDNFSFSRKKLLIIALFLYCIGFIAQFSWLGWVFAEFLYAPAIVLIFYSLFLEVKPGFFAELMIRLGALSYSFFLIHNFFVFRLNDYFGKILLSSFWQIMSLSVIGSLLSAILIDKFVPIVGRAFSYSWFCMDQKLIK
jgi:peptidoglycan/LPS O-acetylase OafA/YrhL